MIPLRKSSVGLILLALTLTVSPISHLFAQQITEQAIPSLQGHSEKDLLQLFGSPDRREEIGTGGETWFYGGSVLFLSGGRVSGWSGAGELSERLKLAGIRTSTESRRRGFNHSWTNVWTPRNEPPKQDILRELWPEASELVDESKGDSQ